DAAFPGHRFASYAQRRLPNGIPGERRAAGQPQDLAARDHRIRRAPHQRGADPMRREAGWGRWWGRLPFVLLVACQARGGARGVPREFDGGHAHSDTRPHADQSPNLGQQRLPVPGANDGASGVAVLLGVADALKAKPPAVGVDLLFVDGEDYGDFSKDSDDVLIGSRYFAAHQPPGYPPLF